MKTGGKKVPGDQKSGHLKLSRGSIIILDRRDHHYNDLGEDKVLLSRLQIAITCRYDLCTKGRFWGFGQDPAFLLITEGKLPLLPGALDPASPDRQSQGFHRHHPQDRLL